MGDSNPSDRWTLRRVFRLPLTRGRSRQVIDDELEFHLREQMEGLVEQGTPRAEAEADVLRRFGDVDSVRDRCVSIADRRRARSRIVEMIDGTAHPRRAVEHDSNVLRRS